MQAPQNPHVQRLIQLCHFLSLVLHSLSPLISKLESSILPPPTTLATGLRELVHLPRVSLGFSQLPNGFLSSPVSDEGAMRTCVENAPNSAWHRKCSGNGGGSMVLPHQVAARAPTRLPTAVRNSPLGPRSPSAPFTIPGAPQTIICLSQFSCPRVVIVCWVCGEQKLAFLFTSFQSERSTSEQLHTRAQGTHPSASAPGGED